MNQEDKAPEVSLKKFLTYSLVGHAVLVILLSVQIYFTSDQDVIDFQAAIKVDMVALPDKIQEQQPPGPPISQAPATTLPPMTQAPPEPTLPLTPPPTQKVAVKEPIKEKKPEPDTINLEKNKNKQKAALDKLKQLSALDRLKEQMDKEQKAHAVAQAKPIKGNAIATGTDLKGLAKLESEAYLGNVHRHMKQYWSLPEYLKRKGLKVEILVKFNEQGIILSQEIFRSSGSQAYDDIALAAVQKSSPVPPPPEKFVGLSSGQGFLFRFSE